MPIRLIAHPRDPIVTTRELDVFFIGIWLILSGWGFASAIRGLPSVAEQTSILYNGVWSGLIGLIALGAAICGTLIFVRTTYSQVTKKRLEIAFCWALILFIAVYPVMLVASGNWPSLILVLAFLWIPAYRIRHLSKRIKQYAQSI